MRVSATLLALALAATACGGGDDAEPDAAPSEGAAPETGGTFSVQINDPENPLIPGNTTESEGNQVLKALFTPLVGYDLETTEVTYDAVAESIESEDNQTWTVTLKDGWTFHDGTPVTAQSFVDSWNYTANAENAQGASYFFSNIEGYSSEAPTAEMSGLEVVDETSFTVTLAKPFAQFPVTVGYSAFAPLPESFFEDPEAFGKTPIGNGPFKADGEFVPAEGFTVSRYEDYAGEDTPIADSVEFRVIPDVNTAYNELLATTSTWCARRSRRSSSPRPRTSSATASSSARRPASTTSASRPTTRASRTSGSGRPSRWPIDREAITTAIFSGARQPAYDVIPPVIDGHREDACKYCQYDPEAAKALLAETDFDASQPVDLWFNAGAGHDQWVQAAGNQLPRHLGITYRLRGDLEFAEYLPLQDEKGMTGPFRLGLGHGLPEPQNFLAAAVQHAALPPNGSNTSFYDNPEFDELVSQGNVADDERGGDRAVPAGRRRPARGHADRPMFFRPPRVRTRERRERAVRRVPGRRPDRGPTNAQASPRTPQGTWPAPAGPLQGVSGDPPACLPGTIPAPLARHPCVRSAPQPPAPLRSSSPSNGQRRGRVGPIHRAPPAAVGTRAARRVLHRVRPGVRAAGRPDPGAGR
jgi:ABC-type transport system substrate-binding protein